MAGSGWWCTRTCLLNNATSRAQAPAGARVGPDYRRNLFTYVNGLNNDTLPFAKMAYDDAVIHSIGIDLGSYAPSTTSFVYSLAVSSGSYAWQWKFGPVRDKMPWSMLLHMHKQIT